MNSPRSFLRWMLPGVIAGFGLALAQAPPAVAPAVAPSPAPAPTVPPAEGARIPRTLDVPDNALVAAGQAPQLDLLYTGDVIGYIEPCG